MKPTEWSDHLRALSEPVLADTPLLRSAGQDWIETFISGFRDERGARRGVDRPLLARLLAADPGPPPQDLASRGIDVRLWWALHDGASPEEVVCPPPGPIVGESAFESGAIETTTETELGALHALWHLGRRERCLEAARWHVDTLQPDNGTNHPWALHVFLALGESDPHAVLHAETLLHNALVQSGRPDRFSACLLLDAAITLSGEDRR